MSSVVPVRFTRCGPMLAAAQLDAFETRRNLKLSPTLRQILLAQNGGVPDRKHLRIPDHPDGTDIIFGFYGLNHADRHFDYEHWLRDYHDYVRGGLLPIASTEASCFICYYPKMEPHAIVYIDVADPLDDVGMKRPWPLAGSIDELLQGLRAE